ncbi:MAG: plsY [Dehalococcoidia bacterium]|nr:plsY [Dehalococcoidia bacterium]
MLLAILVVAAYLLGSIPTANIFTRALKGVDLRTVGSQAVGTSNARRLLGKRGAVLIAALDMLKGALPVLAAQALGLGPGAQMAAGAAAVAGHNWSIFLRMQGGRGVATMSGAVFAAAPVQALLFVATALGGMAMLKNVPLSFGIGVLSLLAWGGLFREGPAYMWGIAGIACLLFAKRLAGNSLTRLPFEGRGRVLIYRLLYDRDVKDREEWLRRVPQEQMDRPRP